MSARWLAVVAVLGLLVLLGASCDSGDPPSTPEPPPAPTPCCPTSPVPPGPTPPTLPPVLGNACSAVVVHASQSTADSGASSATIVVDWGDSASAGGFDWISPYSNDENDPLNRSLEVHVVGWWIEDTDSATRHTLSVEWPPSGALDLRFHAAGDSCSHLICVDGSCDLV